MRKFIGLGFSVGVAVLAGGMGALAADMPAKAPTYTKAAAIADPWTGWYLGVSAGGRWNKDTWTASSFESPAVAFFLSDRDNPHNFNSSSGRLGLYGGYNWRIQQTWIVGLEADFAWANDKTTVSGIPGLVAPISSDTAQMKDKWDGGVRGRLGYLITPTVLLFGTGGVSWMQSQASVTCSGVIATSWCSGTNNTSAKTDSVTKTVVGWTLGAGLEAAVMPDWLLRGEYRYSSYSGYHARLLQGGAAGPTGNDNVVDADIGRIHTQTLLVGLAYRFGR